jgi:hypothetical protein
MKYATRASEYAELLVLLLFETRSAKKAAEAFSPLVTLESEKRAPGCFMVTVSISLSTMSY